MQASSLSFLLSVFFSLSVLMLWFPRAFLNQEITRHSWHLQEAPESLSVEVSGACAFLGYRETRHFMGRARAASKSRVAICLFLQG